MGPILPQINVLGKQLGISADIMGLITSVLPILYILAKPAVGYLMDYFPVKDNATDNCYRFLICYLCGFAENSESHLYCNNTDNDSKLCWLLHCSHAT